MPPIAVGMESSSVSQADDIKAVAYAAALVSPTAPSSGDPSSRGLGRGEAKGDTVRREGEGNERMCPSVIVGSRSKPGLEAEEVGDKEIDKELGEAGTIDSEIEGEGG